MKFTYKFSIEVPQSFLEWLKKNEFKRVGRSFVWKRKKSVHKFCDHLTINILPMTNSYKISLNWWENRDGECDYYDTIDFPSFYDFLRGIKDYQL